MEQYHSSKIKISKESVLRSREERATLAAVLGVFKPVDVRFCIFVSGVKLEDLRMHLSDSHVDVFAVFLPRGQADLAVLESALQALHARLPPSLNTRVSL